jgi:hypothetical protein
MFCLERSDTERHLLFSCVGRKMDWLNGSMGEVIDWACLRRAGYDKSFVQRTPAAKRIPEERFEGS